MNAAQINASSGQSGLKNRWSQLVMGIICMAMVANLQYGWTLFVDPMHDKFGWTKAAIQFAFFIFVLCETWLVPVEGWLMDKFGPRTVVLVGGILAGLSWVMNSYAILAGMLYFSAVVAGVGAGAVYGTCVGNALKWFPDKRGLAAGLTAAGFGAGAALTVIPIANMVKCGQLRTRILYLWAHPGRGGLRGVAVPDSSAADRDCSRDQGRGESDRPAQYRTRRNIKTPVFWMLYICMVLVASGGLMAAAEIGPLAKDYGVATTPVTVLWATLPLLTMALSIDSLVNGLTRPLTGWISDHLGRRTRWFWCSLWKALRSGA